MIKDMLISTSTQKVLSLFARFPDQAFYERELARKVGISPAGAHRALVALHRKGLLKRAKRGKIHLYALNREFPLAGPLQTYFLIFSLEPLIRRLKPLVRAIILFGSAARGDFLSESDIDLLIVSPSPDEAMEVMERCQRDRNIQAIMKTPLEWLTLEAKDPIFYQEVSQGITLYERPIHELDF